VSARASGGTILPLRRMLALRLRRMTPPPPLPATMNARDRLAAPAGHLLLYAAMFVLPITGYLDASLGGYHLSFFGLFDVPMLFAKDEALFEVVVTTHRWIGYGLAALKHHVIDRDTVLTRRLRRG
jgi:cytochrome b561